MRTLVLALTLLTPALASAAEPTPFLTALLSDFKQDGTVRAPEAIVALYDSACDSGDKLACDYPKWHDQAGRDVHTAQALFTKACADGHRTACIVSSWQLTQVTHGHPSPNGPDLTGGIEALTKACRSPDEADEKAIIARACGELAVFMRKGLGTDLDPDAALELALKACTLGDGHACRQAARTHKDGLAKAASASRAAELYKQACAADDLFGCWVAGEQGDEASKTKALEHYRSTCDAGLAEGCYHLAEITRDGKLVDADPKAAAALDLKACQGGEPESCLRLSTLYDDGDGVNENPNKAATLTGMACDAGLAAGCAKLARMFQAGRGVPQDGPGANTLSQRACDGGIDWACGDLGMRYLKGQDVEKDLVKAEALLRQSCEGGTAWACSRIAPLYRKGVLTATRAASVENGEVTINAQGVYLGQMAMVRWVVPGQARSADILRIGVLLADAATDDAQPVPVDVAPDLPVSAFVPVVDAITNAGLQVALTVGGAGEPLTLSGMPLDGSSQSISVGALGVQITDRAHMIGWDALVSCEQLPCTPGAVELTLVKDKLSAIQKADEVELSTLAVEVEPSFGAADTVALLNKLSQVYTQLAVTVNTKPAELGEPLDDALRALLLGGNKPKWDAKKDAWWSIDKAKLKSRQHKYDEAEQLYRAALDAQPGCGQCALGFADLLRRQGHDLAFLDASHAIEARFAKEGEPISARARWYADRGDLTRAEALARHAQEVDKKDPGAKSVLNKVKAAREQEPPPLPKYAIVGQGESAKDRMPPSLFPRFDKVIAKNEAKLVACYAPGLQRDPTLDGELTLQLRTDNDGEIVYAGVLKSTVADEDVQSCMIDVISKLSFPGSDGEGLAQTTYTLILLPR